MIVLDTNVVSALMKPVVLPSLQQWLQNLALLDLYTTAVTRAELRYGIARLPSGARKRALEDAADAYFAEIADRVLPFDSPAADRYGALVAQRERRGRPISVPDAQIASIAFVRHAAVATRDSAGFADCDVPVIDPFADGS